MCNLLEIEASQGWSLYSSGSRILDHGFRGYNRAPESVRLHKMFLLPPRYSYFQNDFFQDLEVKQHYYFIDMIIEAELWKFSGKQKDEKLFRTKNLMCKLFSIPFQQVALCEGIN